MISDEDVNDGDEYVDGDGVQNKPQPTKSQEIIFILYGRVIIIPLPYHLTFVQYVFSCVPQISYDINDDDDLTTPVSSADIARSLLVGKKQSGLHLS